MSAHARFGLAAAICALAAASLTFGYSGRSERAGGPPISVVVAPQGLKAGEAIDEASAALATRRIPSGYAPPDALTDPVEAAGARVVAPVAAGGYVTQSVLGGGDSGGAFKLRAGERALTVDAVVSPSGSTLEAGDRIDLFASGFGGDQRTTELISGAEVLAAEEGAQAGRARATLRLLSSQVAPVIRADVFAHELRAVVRPPR